MSSGSREEYEVAVTWRTRTFAGLDRIHSGREREKVAAEDRDRVFLLSESLRFSAKTKMMQLIGNVHLSEPLGVSIVVSNFSLTDATSASVCTVSCPPHQYSQNFDEPCCRSSLLFMNNTVHREGNTMHCKTLLRTMVLL